MSSGETGPAEVTFINCTDTITVEGNTFALRPNGGPDVWVAGSRALVQNNVFRDATVGDSFVGDPGLVCNPVFENAGLAPDDVQTRVDWDGNGCADYSTHGNERDQQGHCYVEGLPPVVDSGP